MQGVMGWLQRGWAKWSQAVLPYSHPLSARSQFDVAPVGSTESTGAAQAAVRANVLIVLVDGCTIDTLVAGTLARAGYGVGVARGLRSALQNLGEAAASAVIVCGLPDKDTYTALRKATRAPVLALLTQASEAETLDVLAAGADDCQPASIGNAEILSRVRALLRRTYW